VLVLLLLAIGGFGAYLAVDAALRQRVFQWAQAKYMALTGANLHPDLATFSSNGSTMPGASPSGGADDTEAPGGASASAASLASPRRAAGPVVDTVVPRPQTQPAPAVAARPATQPIARPQPPQTRPAEAPKVPVLTHEEAVKKSRDLYIQALDAEERGDYRKAKALYEQIIKTLPPDTWYQGIEGRLRIAKDMLGEK
jgi:hypothetical protein